MMTFIAEELDKYPKLLSTLMSALNEDIFHEVIVTSGRDFLEKLQACKWITPKNPDPLLNLLKEVKYGEIVHKAISKALSTGKFTNSTALLQMVYTPHRTLPKF